MSTTRLTADDISCAACAASIRKALERLDGVTDVQVDVPAKTITVEHDEQRATRQAVVDALDRAGFPATN